MTTFNVPDCCHGLKFNTNFLIAYLICLPASESLKDELPLDLQTSFQCLLLSVWSITLFLFILFAWRFFWEFLISSSESYCDRCKKERKKKWRNKYSHEVCYSRMKTHKIPWQGVTGLHMPLQLFWKAYRHIKRRDHVQLQLVVLVIPKPCFHSCRDIIKADIHIKRRDHHQTCPSFHSFSMLFWGEAIGGWMDQILIILTCLWLIPFPLVPPVKKDPLQAFVGESRI